MRKHHELLRSTSRTFAVGIEALPKELRDAVTLAYLALRVSDYYEDSPTLSPERKEHFLERWAGLVEASAEPVGTLDLDFLLEGIAPEDRGLPDHKAALEAGSILAGLRTLPSRFRSPIQEHTAATTRGMARWIRRGDDFPDEGALDDYMFEVAGRVGLLLTDLFSEYSPGVRTRAASLEEAAVSFGLGLQTVNIIRGLHEDPIRGWTFVPRNLLAREARPADLRSLASDEQERVLGFLVQKAGRHIADALRYCQALPRRERGIRVFCIIPALLASRTAALSAGNPQVFRAPVKVDRRDVGRLVLKARFRFYSNRWLEEERRRALALSGPVDV